MKHLTIILLLVSTVLGQQRVRPIDLTPETLTLIADSAKAIVSDSLATATNYDSVRAIVSDSISGVTTATETRGIVNDSLSAYFPVTNANLNGSIGQDKLAGSIPDSKLNQITTAAKVAGSSVQLGAEGTISNNSGLILTDEMITSAKLKDGSGVNYADLTQAMKDSVAGNGTKNITRNYYNYLNDTTITYAIDSDTAHIDISGWGMTTPVVTSTSYYSGYFRATIYSVTANYLTLQTDFIGTGDSVKVTVGVNEQ